jgi:hypothetical protein
MRTSVLPSFVCGPEKGKNLAHMFSVFLSNMSSALEFMFELPIRAAHNVPGYCRVRRRYGVLRRVRSVAP